MQPGGACLNREREKERESPAWVVYMVWTSAHISYVVNGSVH